jgi:hypothetical protein
MNPDYREKRLSICNRFGVEHLSSEAHQKVGVATNILNGSWSWPLHGLRHPPHSETTGWYIWSGELSESADFFQPLHIAHLQTYCKDVLAYLGLPPGWRFLIAPDHEDVWFDDNLLDVKGKEL